MIEYTLDRGINLLRLDEVRGEEADETVAALLAAERGLDLVSLSCEGVGEQGWETWCLTLGQSDGRSGYTYSRDETVYFMVRTI